MGKLRRHHCTAVMVLGGVLSGAAQARPGDLDPSFNGSGWLAIPMTPPFTGASMALHKDGRPVIAGHHGTPEDPAAKLGVLRFGTDGTPDTIFNSHAAGVGSLAELAGESSVSAKVVIQNDDRVLLTGYTRSRKSLRARFLPDGMPDASFGDAHGISVRQETEPWYGVVDMCLQRDGRILTGDFPFSVYRFDPAGLLDPGFGAAGRVRTPLSGAEAGPVIELADGRILVATRNVSLEGGGGGVRCYHPQGTPDTSFGTGGGFFHTSIYHLSRILQMADGRILLAGRSRVGTDNRNFAVARIFPDGTPDLSFNQTGWTSYDFDEYDSVSGVTVTGNNRIVLAGTATGIGGNKRMAIACFRPDGKLDTAFGNGGTVQVAPGGASLGCFDALPVAGNNLLAAANYTGLTGQPDGIMLVRIQLAAGADMVVRDVAGNVLSGSPDTPPIDLGLVTLGSRSAQFTVRNEGDMPLTDLAVSLTGVSHPGEFSARLFGGSSLAAGGSAEFVVTLTPSAVPGLRTAVLQIANSDRPFSIPLTGLRATPSQMWRLEWFGSPDNSGQGADMNDFDGDGLVNLIEYATGSNPHRPSPQTGQVVKTGDQLEFTYTRSSTALAELTFQPEAAATPAGPWSSVDVMSSVVSEEGGRQTVRVTVPTGSTSRFIRLRITRN